MRATALFSTLCFAACSHDALPNGPAIDAGADSAVLVDATTAMWPKRVTLKAQFGDTGDQLRLADGAIGTMPADLSVFVGRLISLQTPGAQSVCAKGVFASLTDIPVNEDDCPAGLAKTWQRFGMLSATSQHTIAQTDAAGLSFLVRDATQTALYRLRVIGDSYDAFALATVTFDYEPAR